MFSSVHRLSVGQEEQHLSTHLFSEKKKEIVRGGVALPPSPDQPHSQGLSSPHPKNPKGARVRRRKTLGIRFLPNPLPSHRERRQTILISIWVVAERGYLLVIRRGL